MEVKVQLKHLLIFGLIVVFTFTSILLDLRNQIYNPTLNIAFVYDSLELGVENDANQAWEALNGIQKDIDFTNLNSHYDSIELQNVNLSGSMIDHIGEYAVKNEVVVVYGDSYNEKIGEVIDKNPQTEFIMIDSNYDNNYLNLSQIEIDNTDKLSVIGEQVANATKTKKVLFVANSEDAENQLEGFTKEVNSQEKCKITPLIFDDASDNVAIKKALLKEFNNGYDSVYVATRELNKIVIETAEEVQVDILDDRETVDTTNNQIEQDNAAANSTTDEAVDNTTGETVDSTTGETVDGTTDDNVDSESNIDEVTGETVDETNTDETDNEAAVIEGEEENQTGETDEQELLEYKYEQEQINVYVNGSANVSSGIYYTDETAIDPSNVVRAYIDLNIEEVLYDTISDILEGTIEHTTSYLSFDNNGLELIKE